MQGICVQARGVSWTVASGVGSRDVDAGRQEGLGGWEHSDYREALSHSQPACTSQCSMALTQNSFLNCPVMARPLACTIQLWGGIHPALWNHVTKSKGAIFIE